MQHVSKRIPNAQGVSLPKADRDRIRALIRAEGETSALRRLRVARQTLARLIAGLPVREATAEVVRQRLTNNAA
jgi:hypothetical protein